MPLNHYVTLGRSGLRVSPLCLGTMTFGMDWGWGATPEESARILDAYCERGGNFIDTANIYTKGHSEVIIGDWLRARPVGHGGNARRDRLVIATKFMGNMYPGDPNGGGAGRKGMTGACEQSLRRLKTDYIDLYLVHVMDRHTPIDETMRAVDDLVRAGKVRHFGFSDVPAWKCAQGQCEAMFRGWTPAVSLQIEYSLLERTVEGDLIPMAREMGMGVTPWSPLKGGILSGKYDAKNTKQSEGRGTSDWVQKKLDERAFRVIETLRGVAKEGGCSVSQAALAWVQGRPGVTSTIIGPRRLDQLLDNLGALDVKLTPAQGATLDEATRPALPFPHAFVDMVANNVQGGTTINGVRSEMWGMAPQKDEERW